MNLIKFLIENSKQYRGYIFGHIIAVFIISMMQIVQPFLVKKLIDNIEKYTTDHLIYILVVYTFAQLILIGAWWISDYCSARYHSKIRINIVQKFLDAFYHYPYNFFQNHLAGNSTAKISDAFQMIPGLIYMIVYNFGGFFYLVIFTMITLYMIHKIFAVIMFIWISLFLLMNMLSIKKLTILIKQYSEDKAKILGHMADYIGNILSVKIFSAQQYEKRKSSILQDNLYKSAINWANVHTNFFFKQGILNSIYYIGFIAVLIHYYKLGKITAGDFAFITIININISNSLSSFTDHIREFSSNLGAVRQALSIVESQTETQDIQDAQTLQVRNGQITFENVTFSYLNNDSLFYDKSIIINAGEKLGLVGYSGGGKSTFVNLIMRLYDVGNGRILIDDYDIAQVTQDSLHNAIGMIPQDPSLFHCSIIDNIRYGKFDASDEEVMTAAKEAHAHEFITKLPNGYQSLVGERGVKLSGGQRQRIAIARAMLKNAPILILDEATSQLDSMTENIIQDSLQKLMQNKTTIVIAHRLSTLLHMDRILVFDNGKIIEDGTHQDLLVKGGLYTKLWNAQIGGFLPEEKTLDE